MQLDEAKEILKNAGLIVEDKYMDDMDNELDQTLALNKIVTALKDAGYKKCGIKNDAVYVWPVDATERYCVIIEEDGLFENAYYCKILDREKHKYAAKYRFTIKGDTYKRNGFGGETLAFYGKTEDIVRPGKEYIEDIMKPGFFKRLFHKESVNESTDDYREIVTKKLAQIYDRCYDSDDAGRSYAEKHVTEFEPQIAEVLEEGGDDPISPYEVAEVIWYILHHSQLQGESILDVYIRYTRNEPDFFETWHQFNQ